MSSPSLRSLLQDEYALALGPGFFHYYAQIGLLQALEEEHLLNVTHTAGASAGALVAGWLASGQTPTAMRDFVAKTHRDEVLDPGGIGGIFRGKKVEAVMRKVLPVETFEECPIPVGITTWDLVRFRTKVNTSGDLCTAIKASITFPGLFQPTFIDSTPHIDGGVFDRAGLMALPGVPDSSKLIVNVVCGQWALPYSKVPEKFANLGCKLLTIVLDSMPHVHPWALQNGELAYRSANE
jgi:NTE family protein